MKKSFLFAYCLLLTAYCASQENIFTAGFQFKPMLVSGFFNTAKGTVTQNNANFSVQQYSGSCLGMILRRGFTKSISMEFGINYVKRNYNLKIADTTFSDKASFRIVGYEFPVMGLIFLRIGKKVFMNAGMGMSWDIYPSNVATTDNYFQELSVRYSRFQGAMLSNLAFEFRTDKSGYFNIGASYHLPFTDIYNTFINYNNYVSEVKLPGNYLTIDFKYLFHEEPMKPKPAK